MVVKSEVENKTPFGTLPPTTAPENDVLSARIAIINGNLKKKKEPPRFSGGIWDIDDKMDTTDSPDVANRDSVRMQLKTMLQSESPYFEIEDKMDTIETCSSLSFLSPSILEVPCVSEMDITAAKIPVVRKKEPDNMKKKSMDELSLERSKRCRTSSKTEVYPLQSFDVESEFSQAEMLKESRPVEGANAEPILSEVENLLPQTIGLNSPAICKESQIDINDNNMQKDGVGLMMEAQNSYQKEIDVLQKVALILESHNTNKKENKSYSEEVGQLQKICEVLKNLGNTSNPASNGILDANKSVAGGDLAGEAAFTFNDIHHNEYQTTELPNHIKDNLQPVISEDIGSTIQDPCASSSVKVEKSKSKSCDSSVDCNKKSDPLSVNNAEVVLDKSSEAEAIGSGNQSSWLEQIVNGTLPWKPIGRPPPATAFSVGSVQSTNVPNVLNSSIIHSSVSSTNGTFPQTSTNEMLQLKANPEQSRGRSIDTDDIIEMLKNATSRGSPPPMAAFGKSATTSTSPTRTVGKSSLLTQDIPLQMKASVETILPPGISNKKDDLVSLLDEASMNFPKQNAAIEKEGDEKSFKNGCVPKCGAAVETAKFSPYDVKEKIKERGQNSELIVETSKVKPLKQNDRDDILHLHTCVSTSKSVLELNAVNSVPLFKAKTPPNRYRSSAKNPDASSPYQAKVRKSTETNNPLKDNVTMIKETVQPSLPQRYIPPHLRSKSPWSSNNDILKNSQEAQGFTPEAKTSQNHLKSSSKTRDAYSPYPAKERKGTEITGPDKDNVTMNAAVLSSSSGRYIPPHLKPKSPLKSDNDKSSNQQAQGFRTAAWSNWRKGDSPPKLNDLSLTTVKDSYTKLPSNDGKVLNLNVEMNSSSSRSNSSEYLDSSKMNRTANLYERRQSPNDRKVLNIDVKKKKSAYGAQLSEDAMISLKIFDEQNSMVDELILPLSQLVQRRKKFPSLSEIVPSTGEKDKVLMLNGNAVKVFLRSVFSAPEFRFPGWEIALEAYYLAKKYGIDKLQDQCKDYFDLKAIQPSQVQGIVQIARKFQITDILKNSAMFAEVQPHNIPGSTAPITIKEQKCTVSCMVSADPSEYSVPLHYIKETGLGSRIESDIKNEIFFEAKCGTFCLTGLQIKLEAENSDFRKEISILCDVYKSNKKVFDLVRVKPLNKLMIIDFKQRLFVEPGESATISVLMEDACMRMCHCLTKEKEMGRCADGSFEISFESDRKSEAKQPLFFVEKLFYTFEGRKN